MDVWGNWVIFHGNLRYPKATLKLTWHLTMDGWNTSFLLESPNFRCYVSFKECVPPQEIAGLMTINRWISLQ